MESSRLTRFISLIVASKDQALAGTNDTAIMTPQRTAESATAIAAALAIALG
jgi:hypothetical protein